MTPEQQKALALARARRRREQEQPKTPLDDYYSSGIFAGEYNPLGPIAQSIDAATMGARDAMTFGFGDEIYGSVVPGSSIESERARSEALQASNPVATVVGNIGGGVALGAAAPKLLAPLSRGMSQATPLASRIGAGLVEGAGAGALYGFGSGEGTQDRVANALTTGAVGGAFGATVPAVTAAVSGGYRNLKDALARSQVARDAGVDPATANQVAAILAADDSLGPTGMANMQRAGSEAMLVDAGPNAKGALDTVIQTQGPGSTLARQRIADRLARDSSALGGAMDTVLGTPEGVSAAQRNIRQGSQAAVSDAYKLANQTPIDYASEAGRKVEDVIKRIPNRIKSAAIQRANERMIYEGLENQQILADIAEDGTVKFRELPNVMQANEIKKALNEIVNEGTDMTGKMSGDAQFANRMGKDLRDALAEAVPEYKTALATAADPLSRQSAVDLGSTILRPNMTRDQVKLATERMTVPEKDALAQGVRSYIDDTMANVTRTMQDGDTSSREAYKAIRELSSRANREKLELALGAERVKPLFDEIDRVAASFELKGAVSEGSRTFARQETNRQIQERFEPGAIGMLKQGEPLQAGKSIIATLTGNTPEFRLAQESAVRNEIADFLTRDASSAIPAFKAMTDYSTQTAANAARSAEIARLLSMGQRGVYPATVATTN
ncbi:hypothetical protein [Microcystis phage Mwe-JY13]